jgi:hypothetical protein
MQVGLLVVYAVLLVLAVKYLHLHEGAAIGGIVGSLVVLILNRRKQQREARSASEQPVTVGTSEDA